MAPTVDLDLSRLARDVPEFIPEPIERNGSVAFRLRLPPLPPGREINAVEVVLPPGFPDDASAMIQLSDDAILRVPHVDKERILCINGDPGSASGGSADDRLYWLLSAFKNEFLGPWLSGALDGDFETEALTYWGVFVDQAAHTDDVIRATWTVETIPGQARLLECPLLLPAGVVLCAERDNPVTGRIRESLGEKARSEVRVLVADIPIDHPLTPRTWPRDLDEIELLLRGRLAPADHKRIMAPRRRRGRSRHRVVVLRTPYVGFAYHLPGGHPIQTGGKRRRQARPPQTRPRPIRVARMDPSWTVGRDQQLEVDARQQARVVVFGAGALGSPVVDHLAKAGVGHIDLVDPEALVSANLGRHLLGAESLDLGKAAAVAQRVNRGSPHTHVVPASSSAQAWLRQQNLSHVDVLLDLTGEPDVRWHIDQWRQKHACPLLIGWMEPYVAAAHACALPSDVLWLQGEDDPMGRLQAVDWPDDVIQREPGCSSRFQSYTAAAAAHAVALVVEQAINLIDGIGSGPRIQSWVRGQKYLDDHRPDLALRYWARPAAPFDGLLLARSFPECVHLPKSSERTRTAC